MNRVLAALMTSNIESLIKRFNVIYYNNQNMEDIMIKTAPLDSDFAIGNASGLVARV